MWKDSSSPNSHRNTVLNINLASGLVIPISFPRHTDVAGEIVSLTKNMASLRFNRILLN